MDKKKLVFSNDILYICSYIRLYRRIWSNSNMNIVTSSDSNFFHCLQGLAESVRTHYDKKVIVYDVGLTDEERQTVDAEVISIEVDVDFREYASFWKESRQKTIQAIKTTHKPFCVTHYFQNHSEPMLFVDADCSFNERVEETGFDVGVTLRRKGRIDVTNPWTGIINAGVIFFNTYAAELIDAWTQGCQKENTTDQKELAEILSETIDWKHYDRVYDWHGVKVKVFNAEQYNDVRLKDGKIYHWKGRRHEKDIYEKLIQAQKQGENIYEIFNQLTGRNKTSWLKKVSSRLSGK